jgi:uncharacterized protein (DUF2147 family)
VQNMRQISSSVAILIALSFPAAAESPAGDWLVQEGQAHIRAVLCEGRLWGIVSWARHPTTDANNPDPALRSRSMLGVPIILGMQPTAPDHWEGSIYNAQNGKIYEGSVTLKGPDRLEVEGCVLSGWICGGEDWTRVEQPPASVGAAPQPDLCLRLGAGSGGAHEGGLK